MGLGYQFTDRRSFDYEIWYPRGSSLGLRGPRALFEETGGYWTFVGAAQTFGRFAKHPFPELVSSWFDKQHLNLGMAGGGPEFFLNSPELLRQINGSDLCFLQIMSGRSVSTNLLRSIGKGGTLLFTRGPLEGQQFLAAEAYRRLLAVYGPDVVQQQIIDARLSWKEGYLNLIAAITVPIVCVWVSYRDRDYEVSLGNVSQILGDFPHLVTSEGLSAIESRGIDVVGRKYEGSRSQLLLDYSERRPVSIFTKEGFAARGDQSRDFNVYYPVPEMHWWVARELVNYLTKNAPKYLAM